MTWLQALIAGIIQGLTEFLPVSSSGHLVIFNSLLGDYGGGSLTFTVFLHLATLLSVAIMFWRDILMLAREFFALLRDMLRGKFHFNTPERRFLLMVIVGTIPAALGGLIISRFGLDVLENVFVVAFMLLVTAALMFSIDHLSRRGKYTEANAPYRSAWLVGLMQMVAIFPGLSRSGSTIFGGVLGGLRRDFAVRYAFILSIPAIVGAGLLEGIGAMRTGEIGVDNPLYWLIGFVAAALCGIVAIKCIKLLMQSKKFWIFGIYCLVASSLAFLIGFGILGR